MSVFLEETSYDTTIPLALKNDDVGVQLYPVLFEMGVDIRQWGVNTGSKFGGSKTAANAGKQVSDRKCR